MLPQRRSQRGGCFKVLDDLLEPQELLRWAGDAPLSKRRDCMGETHWPLVGIQGPGLSSRSREGR